MLITIKTIGARGDFLHHDKLVEIRLAKNRVQSCHHWHSEVPQQTQDVAAGFPSKQSMLVLANTVFEWAACP